MVSVPQTPESEPPILSAPSRPARSLPTRSLLAILRVYFRLTKPRVIELLLVTTVPAMVLAQQGLPPLDLIGAVLVGGALSAGGANTINCWIERDRDQVMRRTHARPLPAGEVAPRRALIFGLALEAFAFAFLWATVNLLSASLAVAAMLFYVFVYTIWLKPRSDQNIVIGGAAGAVPVLVGWASVTNTVSAPAWVLFAVIFFWTPPHFWALALRYRDDYAAAGIPMLPVVRGEKAAVRHIFLYSWVVVATTLALPLVTTMTPGYAIVVGLLGAVFVWRCWELNRQPNPERAIKLFMFSNVYLALVFAAVAIDTLVRSA